MKDRYGSVYPSRQGDIHFCLHFACSLLQLIDAAFFLHFSSPLESFGEHPNASSLDFAFATLCSAP